MPPIRDGVNVIDHFEISCALDQQTLPVSGPLVWPSIQGSRKVKLQKYKFCISFHQLAGRGIVKSHSAMLYILRSVAAINN